MAKKSKMMKITERTDYNIALYVRVSTDAQREEGYSIEIQSEALLAYAKSMYGKEAKTELYIDGGFSGSSLDRPEMQRMIKNIQNNVVTHVIVYKLDRLSRSQKDTLHLIEDILLPQNVAFISIKESFNTDNPMGRAMLGIISVFAQLERENIYERMKGGMIKRIESGLWMGGGRIPFGYDYDAEKGILIPNQHAETVKKIYELYIEGYSLQHIANQLGLRYEKLAYQILMRKSNAGFIVYNGEEYVGQHEAIISLETYEKAMALFKQRSSKKYIVSDHLLAGLVYCGKCGAKMRYQKWGSQHKLVCYSQQKYKPYLIKDPNCDNTKPWAAQIEKIVIDYLFKITKQSIDCADPIQTISVLEILRSQYNTMVSKLKRLYGLYSEASDDYLLDTINELKQDIQEVMDKIRLEEEKALWIQKKHPIQENLDNITSAWDYMTMAEKQNIVRSVINKITVIDNNVNVELKL